MQFVTLKCQSTSVENILLSVSSSKESIPTIFMCLVNLLVISFLPHPGGLKAVTRWTSRSSIFEVSFLSYQWAWSIHYKHDHFINFYQDFQHWYRICIHTCLNSSTGGIDPQESCWGRFKSSTNTIHFLPMAGPKTPFLLLSNLDMITSCV